MAGNRFSGRIPESLGTIDLQRVRWRHGKGRHNRGPSEQALPYLADNGGLLCPLWKSTKLSVLKPGVDCRFLANDKEL